MELSVLSVIASLRIIYGVDVFESCAFHCVLRYHYGTPPMPVLSYIGFLPVFYYADVEKAMSVYIYTIQQQRFSLFRGG